MKKGTRVKTPHGKGTFIEIGKGKCIHTDITGMYLVKLDTMIDGHFNFYYNKSEIKIL